MRYIKRASKSLFVFELFDTINSLNYIFCQILLLVYALLSKTGKVVERMLERHFLQILTIFLSHSERCQQYHKRAVP